MGADLGETAYDLGAGALDDAADATAGLGVARVTGGEASAAQGGVELHHDGVAGESGEGVAGADLDVIGAGGIGVGVGIGGGDDIGGAAGAELNATGDFGVILGRGGRRGGFAGREGVAVTLDLHDFALGEEQAQFVKETGAEFGREL